MADPNYPDFLGLSKDGSTKNGSSDPRVGQFASYSEQDHPIQHHRWLGGHEWYWSGFPTNSKTTASDVLTMISIRSVPPMP